MLSGHEIVRIRYFTAKVSGLTDVQSPTRQQTYLRALRTIPHLSIHLGTFQHTKPWERLVTPFPDLTALPPAPPAPRIKVDHEGNQRIKVHKSNEKGSDVNLASYLLLDAFRRHEEGIEAAAVITNDSDLVTPIAIVRDELELPVIVLDPKLDPERENAEAKELKAAATFYRKLRPGAYAGSQFPTRLRDAKGWITKPRRWWREAQRAIATDLLLSAGAFDRCERHHAEVFNVWGDHEEAKRLGREAFRTNAYGDAFLSEADVEQAVDGARNAHGDCCDVCARTPDGHLVHRLSASW